MISPYIFGPAYTAINKALEKKGISPKDISFRQLRQLIKTTIEILDGVSLDEPVSLVRAALRAIEIVLGKGSIYDSANAFLEQNNYKYFDCGLDFLKRAAARNKIETIYDDKETINRVDLGDGVEIVCLHKTGNKWSSDLEIYQKANTDTEEVKERIGNILWNEGKILQLDASGRSSGYKYSQIEIDAKYHGEMRKYFDRWKIYKEEKVRRCILLYGRPGAGKTIFAHEAANILGQNVLSITGQFCKNVSNSDWLLVLEMLKPDVVIMNDLDRLSYGLEERLRIFEEQYCDIPFIFITANSLTNIPDAMLRPGRIDQTLEFSYPSTRGGKVDLIKTLASRQDVSNLSDNEMAELIDVMQEKSTAYVVEKLKRKQVEKEPLERNDITFDIGINWEEEQQEDEKDETTTVHGYG